MPSYDLCIVIPTLNERENIGLLTGEAPQYPP